MTFLKLLADVLHPWPWFSSSPCHKALTAKNGGSVMAKHNEYHQSNNKIRLIQTITDLCFCTMCSCTSPVVVDIIILLSGVRVCTCVCQQASQQSSPQAVWVVPALRQLHEITRSFIKQTYQKQDKVTQTHTIKMICLTISVMSPW